MKRSLKRRGSVRNRPPADDNGTPMSMQSTLFSCQSTSESIVVPETPNNSFNCKVIDMSITGGTVLETPDSPLSEIVDSPENAIPQPPNKNNPDESYENLFSKAKRMPLAGVILPCDRKDNESPLSEVADSPANTIPQPPNKNGPDDSYENLFSKSNAGKVREKGLMSSSDEDDFNQDITRKFNMRSMNIMSLLESDNVSFQSLPSQNQKDILRAKVDKQYFRCISPVKGKKRRSLAEVILPFDLNDNDRLSNKLKSIKKIEETNRKIRQTRASLSSAKTKANKSRQIPVVKSRVSLQFSDLKIKETSAPKCDDPQVKNTSSCPGGSKSKNSSNFFSDNEDLDVTALSSVNESIISIIKGLQSENTREEADNKDREGAVDKDREGAVDKDREGAVDKDSFTSNAMLHAESTSLIPQQPQVKQTPPQKSSVVGGLCEPEELNRSEIFSPTQPASTLILEGVVAYVEVRIHRANHSDVIRDQLIALGAAVREKLTSDVTHVVFKDGSKGTFNRAKKRGLHLVSSLWVDACKETFQRAPEALYPSTSLESYSNPLFLSRLRKQKSMQPRDLGEEERIADIKAKRKRKVLKSALVSQPLEENYGFCTPKRKSPDVKEDVNSPLFGISHLLMPKQRLSVQSSSDIETSTAESDLDASYCTPLSRRLYNRLVIGRENEMSRESLVNESGTCISTNSNKRSKVSKSSSPSGSTIDKVSASQNQVEGECRSDNRNISGVLELHLSSETNSELETGDEHADILGSHLLDQRPRSRRSQRLVLKSNTSNKRKNQCERDSSLSENDQWKDKSREDGSIDKEKDSTWTRPGKEHGKTNDDSDSQPSDGLNSQRQSRRKSNIHNSKEKVFKGKQKSCPSRGNETPLDEKSNLASCSRVKECDHREECKNLGTDEVGSISNSLNSTTSKRRGRKLLSLECLEPSQELIIPTTPLCSKYSKGPYSCLHVKNKKPHRTALRELVSSGRTISRGKKETISKRGVSRSLLSKSSSTSESSVSDENRLSLKILPLPTTRDSIEEFVSPITSSGRKCRSSKKILYLTSFHSKERKCAVQIIKKLGKFKITNEVDRNTTHVVCGEERRTLSVLYGIAYGLWILDKSWLYESLDLDMWAPEEPFELFNYCPAAKICREQRQAQGTSYRQKLFSGVGNVCVLEGCKPPSEELRALLSLCGCSVVSDVRNANLVVCNPTITSGLRNRIQVTHVSELWILDSVQHHKVQNIDNYKLVDNNMESEQQESESTSL
ncbi:microcephalin [Palaemon carinicauda]|uniref:microcephalin n=1 Tax=Palaemon carinicauda TaxID=392227 RepID=UPI0035B63817